LVLPLLISEQASQALFRWFAIASGALSIFSVLLRWRYKGLCWKLDNVPPADLPGSGGRKFSHSGDRVHPEHPDIR
jgi:hypothetical protein